MLINELAVTTQAVAATRSRLAKIATLAELLSRLQPAEIAVTVGFLLAKVRQGRIGIGWSTIAAATAPPAAEPSLTILDLDQAIDEIAVVTGAGSTAARAEILRNLTARATADEQDLIARILLGDIRIGALEGVLVDAVAKAAALPSDVVRRATMLAGDLGAVAVLALSEDSAAVQTIGLKVGVPVQPMLASTAEDALSALEITGPASVEFKFDGARIQVHRSGEQITVYTRSLADITARVPEVVAVARSLDADTFILDGESLALTEDGGPRTFQETLSRFGADAPREMLLQPFFFDVLHLDGVDLIDLPLSERLLILHRLAGAHCIPGQLTDSPAAADDVAAEALAAGHEGIMVKALDSPYAAGRRGKSWVKIKPVHTFDLVVLAAEWGYGRRTGWLSNLHLGALDPEGRYGGPGDYVMVGKTFKGLTDKTLTWQTERFQELETRRTKAAVFIRPEVVVEIALDGVQRSVRYPGGIALRFARVKAYRPDKRPEDADTIGTLRQLLTATGAEPDTTRSADPPASR